ncbi:butyrophilin subfamily 1 member A1-like [Lissotriton helveticus]
MASRRDHRRNQRWNQRRNQRRNPTPSTGGQEIPRLMRQAIILGVLVAVNVFISIVLYRLVERAVFYSPRVQSCAGLPDEAGECPGSSQNPPRSLLKTSLCLHPVSQYNLHDRQGRLPGQSCPRVRNEPGTEDSSPWRDLQPHLRETLCLHRALVTLDPDTAHQGLILSEDGRRVTWTDRPQPLPDSPKRITDWPCVLGREGFTSGRYYWEVQDEGGWGYVGVTGGSLGRESMECHKGVAQDVMRIHGDQYWALSFTPPLVSPRPCLRLGLYLDYEGGRLSFYNADSWEHLCTSNGPFTGGVHPLFWVWGEADLRLV